MTMKSTHCIACGKDMTDPRTGKVKAAWIISLDEPKKNHEWMKVQLGEFAFLLGNDIPEVNVCWECTMKSYGLDPQVAKEILEGERL